MNHSPIFLSRYDCHRLRVLLEEHGEEPGGRDLRSELDAAVVLPAHVRVPAGLVTIDAYVVLEDLESRETDTVVLTLPDAMHGSARALSVLEPLGALVLGRREGDVVACADRGSDRPRRLKILRVMHSPVAEAAGTLSVI